MRNIIRKFITALALATFAAATAWAQPSNWDPDPIGYKITSADDWLLLADYVNTHEFSGYDQYYLTTDISFEDKTFVPIGNADHKFQGRLIGFHHTISHVNYTSEGGYVGLVGNLGESGSVSEIRLDNSSFRGGSNVGGIVGYICSAYDSENKIFGGRVHDCVVLNTTVSLNDLSNGRSCGVIVGYTGGYAVVSDNYYHNCKKVTSGGDFTSGIGYGYNSNPNYPNMDENGQAQIMYHLSLPSGVTTTATPVFTSTSGSDKYYVGTITLSEPPTGYIYSVYGQAITGNSFTINADAVVTFVPDPEHFSQSGNSYYIRSAAGWNVFCDLLENNEKGYFTGKTVYLVHPITVTRMAGSDYHDFTGTFRGQELLLTFNYTATENYAAPFRNVENATIEDVRVTGTITTSAQFAAGIVARQSGTVTISNCRSNITISSSKSGGGTHGGLVAETLGENVLTIEGCVFDGKLLGTSTTHCGGFVGWNNHQTTISDCLFAPAEITVGTSESATFARGNSPTLTRSYYTTALGSAQGTQPLVTATEPAGLGAQVTKYSSLSITSYVNGLYWVGSGYYYYDTPAAWSSSNTEYTINNAGDWGTFCDLLDNKADVYFYTKTVKLGADITVTRMAGSSGHAFMGIFDGQGHTLTFNYAATEEYAAPFRYVNSVSKNYSGVIKNLHTAGTITTSAKYAAGIVACLSGPVTITNCRSNVTISSSLDGDGTHGGLVARSDGHPYISGCVFDGKLLGTSTTHCGGFVGWNNNEASITDCLFAPTEVTVGNTESATFARGYTPTLTRSYYTTALGSTPGTPALVSTIQPSDIGTEVNSYSGGIISYTNGLYWNGKYYHVTYEAWDESSTEYTINYVDDWNNFCDLLAAKDKYYFKGKTVKLGANITVTRMAGEENHDFTGTFDGQGHTLTFNYTATADYAAPFRYVNKYGVIKNLHTTGTITTSAKYAAGIIAYQGSTVPITNCRSSITIRSSINGDGTHGGLVAKVSDSETDSAVLTIEGCVFDGKIVSTGAAPTTDCGGFVGWKGNHGTLNIADCLYVPQADVNAVSVGATFARNWSGTPTNSYYTQVLGDAQGTAAIITTDKPDNIGAMGSVYSVSGITPYAKGLYRDGNYYSANPTFNQNLTLVEGKVANIVKSSGPVAAYKYVGTFYNATSNYQLPDGAMAYTAKNNGGNWEFYRIGTESNIIPANTAVVIVSDAASIELVELESDPGITAGPNDLQGSDGAVSNTSFDKYVLGRLGGDKDYLGFYKYSGSSIPAGKAYYVPQN